MQVTIYSSTTCPFCKQLGDYLTQRGVVFVEKMIDKDESAKKEMEAVSGGFFGVPFILVTKDNGSRETITGFDKGKIDSVFKLI